MKGAWMATGTVIAASALLFASAPAGLAGSGGPALREARSAARSAVLAHSSYRVIRSTHPLRVSGCRRASRRVVRCILYRLAPTPCALDGRTGICVQVIARRVWQVDVRLRAGRAVARIAGVTETTAG